MAQEQLIVGEFNPFVDDVEAAVLSGATVDRCIGILATRPPFRNRIEASQLAFDDSMQARRMALSASEAMGLSLEVGRLESSTDMVVVSKSGALALRSSSNHVENEVIHLVQELDEGNYLAPIHAHAARIG